MSYFVGESFQSFPARFRPDRSHPVRPGPDRSHPGRPRPDRSPPDRPGPGGPHSGRVWLERCPGWHLGEVPFAVRLVDGTTIGTLAYRNVDRRRRSAELGIELEPAYRSQGYGPEAILTLLHYLFDGLGLERVWLRVFPENVRAIYCYTKCGFRDVGEGRAYLLFPCRIMELDRENYYRLRDANGK